MRTVEASSEKWICLTGGEPLLQRESPELVNRITGSGRSVLLETSGSLPIDPYVHSKSITIDMDVKTPSSGEEKSLHRQNLKLLRKNDYLKFVIADKIDYEYARRFISENE
jgi:Organic radical activating enzymes